MKAQLDLLELNLKEIRLTNLEYQAVAEDAGQKHRDIQKELGERLKDVVSVESIKKDRDERIAALREEVKALEKRQEDFDKREIAD